MSVDIDAVGVPTRIVDGDTLYVRIVKFYDYRIESRIGTPPLKVKIRLADIDAPEIYTYAGKLVANALRKLVDGKVLYLDIERPTRLISMSGLSNTDTLS